MMRWIVGASLQSRLLVAAVAAGLIIYGITQIDNIPVDVLPEFAEPYVEIQTEALGLSAAEVEALITVPLEADMLNGAPWLKEIRSQSIPGLSSIVMVFEPGTDILKARQMVMERTTEVFTLPNVSKPPVIINPVSSAGRVMMIGLSSEKLSPIEMSVLARWTIAPRLTGVNGVANVSVWGERRRQLQVQVDPQQLKDQNIRLQQVIKTAGNALWFSPLTFLDASTPGTSGFIDTPNQRLGVRHRLPISTAEDLAQVTVEGSDKRLGDVAKVVEDHQPLIGDAMVNGEPSLLLVVEKFPWANTVDVTKAVEDTLNGLRPGLAGLEMDTTLFRPATYIESAAGNLSTAVLIAAALIVVAIGAFLLEFRAGLIATISILVSYVAAVLILHFYGVTMNAMVLAGLVVALGVIIDDAVINIENMVRQLRLRRQANSGESFAYIIREAALELRGTMLFATVIMLLIAMPAFFISGTIGAFLQPVTIAYGVAIVVSMCVALTVTPALSVMLLPTSPLEGTQSAVVGQLQHGYASGLSRIVENPRPAFAAACLLALAGFAMFISLKSSTGIPTFKERDLLVEIEATPGSSLPAMNGLITKLSHELQAIPGVRSVAGHSGRAVLSDVVKDVNTGQMIVGLDRDADHDEVMDQVQQVVAGYSGADIDTHTYLDACVTDPQRFGTESNEEDIVVRIYGDDWKILRAKAAEVEKGLEEIDGIATAKQELPLEEPQIEIEVNLEKAKEHGVRPGDVRRIATTLINGLEVGYLYEQQKVFDVVVWGAPAIRDNLSKIENLLIETPAGSVPLKDIADVRMASSPTNIKRETVARYVEVVADVKNRGVASVAADVERRLKDVEFPLEYRAELLRGSAERVIARNRAIGACIAAAIGVYLVLQACVGSWGLATVLFLTLPAAIAGGALAAFAFDGNWSLAAIFGLVAVLGIAVRNSLGLIKHYQLLAMAPAVDGVDGSLGNSRGAYDSRSRMMEATSPEDQAIYAPGVVQRGTWERFTPILMTAVITALAMLPLIIMGDKAGSELLRPMAIVILGGLITSTLFSLIAVPSMFLLFTPSRGPELEDLERSLVGEQELHETIAAGKAE